MVTPLEDRASDEQESAAPLRYSAAWHTADASIADARTAVRALLAQAYHDPHHRPSQDAQLVVSELVTNALRHAPGPGGLALEVAPDAALLRIAVSDSSPARPNCEHTTPAASADTDCTWSQGCATRCRPSL